MSVPARGLNGIDHPLLAMRRPAHCPNLAKRFDHAQVMVIKQIEAGKLIIFGHRGDGDLLPIPPEKFSGIEPQRHHKEPYLHIIGPADGHAPKGGQFQDALYFEGKDEPSWVGLRAAKIQVACLWSFNAGPVARAKKDLNKRTSDPSAPAALVTTSPSLAEPTPAANLNNCLRLSDEEPRGTKAAAAWRAMRDRWPNGVPLSLSHQEIADVVNKWLRQPENGNDTRGISPRTVSRVLKAKLDKWDKLDKLDK